jgi:Xaa-Pro aminopeptidase
MRSAAPGMFEYQLAAVAEFVYLWHGASGYAFFPIVGSGPNSCMPHYHANGRRMEEGDIVVMDFGPDSGYYASDITRTFPVSGRFNAEQARVYRVVLEAQKAALRAVRPGATFNDVEDAADKVLRRGGYDRYKKHVIGHYVGMAVHDVGEAEPFQPGMVLAVEPGVYIPEKSLGIRIEDTVAVTESGCEILTGDVPKEMDEIEKLMSQDSHLMPISDGSPLAFSAPSKGKRETGIDGKPHNGLP